MEDDLAVEEILRLPGQWASIVVSRERNEDLQGHWRKKDANNDVMMTADERFIPAPT